MRYRTVVFVGPSAIGKSYALSFLSSQFPEAFAQAKVHTNRVPRNGEIAADRVFITTDEFANMVSTGQFVLHGEFGGNLYGYTKDALTPQDRHILINIWPAITPQVARLDGVLLVGMQAPENWKDFLTQRLMDRGETPENIQKRLKLIEMDIKILATHKDIIQQNGVFVTVENNQTIEHAIVPWLKDHLSL